MIVNDITTGIIAIIIGYLLGSIPSAYIAARLAKGKDIRQLGGGNVGGLNVFREVGLWAALVVGIVDFGKGAAAVAIAYWLLQVPTEFVLLAGLASVIGHNWMVFLKFSGGKGMGATFGALIVLLPVYGYWLGLVILLGIILIPFMITRNIALSMGIGLLALPFIIGLGMKSGIGTILAVILGLVIAIRFLPTARAALIKSKTKKDFVFDHWQRDKKEEM
jgi:glycerol-3-phosphate acyltransferase PlsY